MQNRQRREEREAAAADDRRKRTATILGHARVFLTDIDPDRVAFNVDPTSTPPEFEALNVRLNALRNDVSVFAAADDDDEVMTAAARLEAALFTAFVWAKRLAGDVLSHRDFDARRDAKLAHLRSNMLVRIVLDRVRGRDVSELEALLRRVDSSSFMSVDELDGLRRDFEQPLPE